MTTTILIGLIALSSFLAIKWKLERDAAVDICADCLKQLSESAKNTYKSEYVEQLKKENEKMKNYLLNHNPLEL